ncbi:invasion associated locus B family protein [Hymenobacter armeniacus]|uniref:Uncharacterized protein n=1 Tax=Hymenobacter armeniacus TaxID=2771358 RepID=A0ABR8JQI9_9BACT|nr:hypothetical protein [Hymenobacter armeniacus]MBD2721066.1 hypothetical protein [Hymenobacter armeniacus]
MKSFLTLSLALLCSFAALAQTAPGPGPRPGQKKGTHAGEHRKKGSHRGQHRHKGMRAGQH